MFPQSWSLARILRHALCEILMEHRHVRQFQKLSLANQEKMMSALDDLKTKVTTQGSDLSELSSDVDAFITANSGGASDADLAAVGQLVDANTTTIDAIKAKVAPPAPPVAG